MSRKVPETCANCGGDIPPDAHSCPHCGADERTGWAETDLYDGIELPGEEETAKKPGRQAFSPMVLTIIAVFVLCGLLSLLF